jgi:hypothetical protein
VSGSERVQFPEAEAPSAPPRALRLAARLGLVARGLFYLLLAGLAAQLALDSGGSGPAQANANGALTQVAGAPLGFALLAGAALGFLAFALVRVYGAITDGRHGVWRRLSTAGQGVIYIGMALVTASFLLGRRGTGSEQQQRSTAQSIITWPFGRALLVAAGLVVLAMCGWQLLVAARGDFTDSLRDGKMSALVRRLTLVTARVGIPARALAVAPVGVFLVVAAIRADPQQAKGLDAVLLDSSRTPVGRVLVVLAAAGFLVFALYSLLEARYREVASGV